MTSHHSLRAHLLFATLAYVCAIAAWPVGPASAKELRTWSRSPGFDDEVSFTATIDPKVRIHVNAPATKAGKPERATRLIVYALPNGNTLEQTLGCKMKPGMDWHYDIQHVAAQVRLLRTLLPKEKIVLVCAEAPLLTWPNFRATVPDANAQIRTMVDDWRKEFGRKKTKVTLTGHSGGGAFMFGVIDGGPDIPDYIDRIAFLDSNYSFDATLHAEKLERWLKADKSRRFIVIAYDDREIALNGKKVVGPTGGTFRATGRMHDALRKMFELTDGDKPPFKETTGLDGRIHFFVHTNPENKILHTVLVGEMNGLVHAATLGTPQEEKWGKFGGPRAYTKWVQLEPEGAKTESKSEETKGAAALFKPTGKPAKLNLPKRASTAPTGSQFIKSVDKLGLDQREASILQEILNGNFPNFLRTFHTEPLRGKINSSGAEREIEATIQVMPDYLAIGSDDDFVRIPMTPQTAQRICDEFGCTLPTRKMVDAIDARAEVRVAPHPMTEAREAVATFAEHNQIIEKQRAGKPDGLLITGIKKDIVLTPRIFEKPQRLAIYGWRQLNGQPIQPLTIVHWDRYVDYSHGARLVANSIEINGREMMITDVLADPALCGLVSDEGPMKPPRYPTD